jgi:hypothetical protein
MAGREGMVDTAVKVTRLRGRWGVACACGDVCEGPSVGTYCTVWCACVCVCSVCMVMCDRIQLVAHCHELVCGGGYVTTPPRAALVGWCVWYGVYWCGDGVYCWVGGVGPMWCHSQERERERERESVCVCVVERCGGVLVRCVVVGVHFCCRYSFRRRRRLPRRATCSGG